MKNKPRPIIIGFALIALISIIWWLKNSPTEVESDNSSTATSVQLTETQNEELENEDSNRDMAEPIPTFVDTTPKQIDFSKKIASLVEATKACQRDVELLFPVDNLDGPSKTYKTFSQFKDAIEKFYRVVEQRIEKSNDLMNFLETMPEGEISPDRLFSQLSSIEDCGEFEEEAILDQAMTTALELSWPSDQKRELTNLILSLFENQIQSNLGLHQLSSKIEVIHSLLDDGFISSNFSQELTALDQIMETAETEFRQSLPTDISQKSLPALKDVIDIKNAEREATDKVRPQTLDVISLIKSRN